MPVVRAGDLKGGQWFRKLRGAHRHLVISESACDFHELNQHRVYGVSLETGNLSDLDPEVLVMQIAYEDLDKQPEVATPFHPLRYHLNPEGERCHGGPECSCKKDVWRMVMEDDL